MITDSLRELSPPPRLPLVGAPGSTRPNGQFRGEHRLAADPWRALRGCAAALGVAASTALAAAFAATVAAWSKEPRFAIGLGGGRTGIDTDETAASLLDSMRGLQMRRPLPMSGPVVVSFSSALGDGWPARGPDPATGAVLGHHVAEDRGELVLRWDAAADLFPTGLLADLIATQTSLVERLAHEPDLWTGPIPDLLPPRQVRARQVVNGTGTAVEPVLLHEPFWRQAVRTPRAPAVVATDRTVSYGELRTAAAAVAARLTAVEPPRGRVVAVLMDRGWEPYAAVLGILAAGAAYVPITPDLPTERIHHLLRHSGATVAVSQPGVLDRVPLPPGVRPIVVTADLLTAGGDNGSPGAIPRRQDPDDLAYIIYTSGSTGQPKGVMISHQNAVNTIVDINRRFRVRPGDRVFALSSLGFDLSVYDIFGLLAAGGAIVVPPPHAGRAPWEWAELLDTHRVTIWNTVPALMEMLVEYAAGRQQRLAGSLRLVLMSGDWIPVTLPDRIRRLADPGIQLIGLGGATEASIWSNFYPIGAVDPGWPSIPYGRPLANQFFEVLDPGLRRRPDLVPGELYIGGAGVAMGYWRDPDRTARSFIRHPRTGQRLYRTGDLGRYLPDGDLEFLGREDTQVKIHGYRIELGEIEATLLAHPEVTGVVVTAVEASGGGKRLLGYVTPAEVDVAGLRAHLAAKLPGHMVPDHILALDAFPLTANGKVDRRALPRHPGTAR